MDVEQLSPDGPALNTVEGDSVYWVNNVAQYPDDYGNTWRWEREGAAGIYSEVRLYKNGSYLAKFNLEYQGSDISGDLVVDVASSGWMDRTPDGTIEASGTGSGGSTDGPVKAERIPINGRPFDLPGQGRAVECDESLTLMTESCDAEYDQMQQDAWEAAMVGGLGAFFTVVSGGAALWPAAIGYGIATVDAVGSLGQWVACKMQ